MNVPGGGRIGGLRRLLVLSLIFGRSQLLRIGQIVDGDGQEDVEQGVVAEEREDDEVERVDVARSVASLGLYALIHDLVPVLARENLNNNAFQSWVRTSKTTTPPTNAEVANFSLAL